MNSGLQISPPQQQGHQGNQGNQGQQKHQGHQGQQHDSIANGGTGTTTQTWEALTTPMGKHMYWYNWSNGESQWEKPKECLNVSDSQLGHRVMPATPKGGGGFGSNTVNSDNTNNGTAEQQSQPVVDKASDLWESLKARSKTINVWTVWQEYQDSRTNELFYYNQTLQSYQWDQPTGWSPTVAGTQQHHQQHQQQQQQQDKWQMVTTPLGRSLYWYVSKLKILKI